VFNVQYILKDYSVRTGLVVTGFESCPAVDFSIGNVNSCAVLAHI
jgi:hypothetical protein